jgi:hypothetical protein
MNRVTALLVVALIVAVVTFAVLAQQPRPGTSQPAENDREVSYHLTVMMPQYRFVDTSGYGGRVGEYDSLQQSLGGDLSFDYVNVPEHMTIKSTWDVLSRDDYDLKSRITFGKWLDFTLDNRSFVRHLDDNSYFGAAVISPDIIRIDSIPPDSLLGIKRRMNNASLKLQLPKIPVKLFVKGGWMARDGNSQMQYFDMGGDGTLTDTGCDNCHSASQYRTYNYTAQNIAGGAEVTLGKLLKLVYQHEYPTSSRSEHLDALIKEKKYLELTTALNDRTGLETNDYAFFAGVLANRTNRLNTSIRLLKQALPTLQKQGRRDREQIALETLADGYSKLYRYAEAADTYTTLEKHLGNQMGAGERARVEREALHWRLLRHVPPQSVTVEAAFTMATKRNLLGVLEVPVEIHGETQYWIVDTGANVSAMSRSAARRLGLQPLEGSAEVKGASGSLVPIHVAVVPELRIGKATLHNAVFVLLDDQDLLVTQVHYQIDGIIGYPVLAALGKITFYRNGTFGVGVSTKPLLRKDHNLFVEKQTPLAAARIGGTVCLFTLDTGTQRTILTARYYREHTSDFVMKETIDRSVAGVGGTRSIPSYTLESIPIEVGGRRTILHDVPVLTDRVGKNYDDFCGNLGLDAVEQFSAFTLDFDDTHFYVH